MQQSARNFHNYRVWQDAVDFATLIYNITAQLPWFEKKGLCDQLQRAVVSISSNIAEGAGRPTDADFAHFLDQSLGSANEVETQLLISKKFEIHIRRAISPTDKQPNKHPKTINRLNRFNKE